MLNNMFCYIYGNSSEKVIYDHKLSFFKGIYITQKNIDDFKKLIEKKLITNEEILVAIKSYIVFQFLYEGKKETDDSIKQTVDEVLKHLNIDSKQLIEQGISIKSLDIAFGCFKRLKQNYKNLFNLVDFRTLKQLVKDSNEDSTGLEIAQFGIVIPKNMNKKIIDIRKDALPIELLDNLKSMKEGDLLRLANKALLQYQGEFLLKDSKICYDASIIQIDDVADVSELEEILYNTAENYSFMISTISKRFKISGSQRRKIAEDSNSDSDKQIIQALKYKKGKYYLHKKIKENDNFECIIIYGHGEQYAEKVTEHKPSDETILAMIDFIYGKIINTDRFQYYNFTKIERV